MRTTGIKGRAFECFVRELLIGCGFQSIPNDDLLIYRGTAGQMIHGLGQPHNADVLMSPPLQIPFYFPSRLLVECKCYDDELGLGFVRNVLGLRVDINNFEIVNRELLHNRRSNRSTKPRTFDFPRYVYQVALASLSGFKKTAVAFANTHRIPLISFAQSDIFSEIRLLINLLDDDNI